MGIFTKNLGIDAGSAYIRVCTDGKYEVFSQPSLAVIDAASGKVVCVGDEAEEMMSDTPGDAVAVRPVKGGVLAEYDVACEILKKTITRVLGKQRIKPVVTVAVPSGATDVEIRALKSALIASGAKSVQIIETAVAAALGAGFDVNSTQGRMIVDIGAGSTEIAVICMGEVVCGTTLRIAGNDFDNDIKSFVKKHYGINIGEKTAEITKINIGSLCEQKSLAEFTVNGRDAASGLPGSAVINSAEVGGAVGGNVKRILDAIRFVLEKTPIEILSDISQSGIVLTGGGARFKGLCDLIRMQTGIETVLADNCETAVVRGCAIAISNTIN